MKNNSWKHSERAFARDLGVRREGPRGGCDFQDKHCAYELKTNKAMPESVKRIQKQIETHSKGKIPVSIWKDKGKGISRKKSSVFLKWEDWLKIIDLIRE